MASQLEFFGTGPFDVANDGGARIAYYPDVLELQEASRLFTVLHASAPWNAERMWMYDHEVEVPRLLARYEDARVPPELAAARERTSH